MDVLSIMDGMGTKQAPLEWTHLTIRIQGEPHSRGLIMVRTYWMGPSSVKIASGLYPFHLLDFISLAAIPSAA